MGPRARDDDPHFGPDAPVLGQRNDLGQQLDHRHPQCETPTPDPAAWGELLFAVGMLRELHQEVVLDLREHFPEHFPEQLPGTRAAGRARSG